MMVSLISEKKQDSLGFGLSLSSERSLPPNVGFSQDALYSGMRRSGHLSPQEKKEDFIVFSIKVLAVAAVVSAGVVLATPAPSQAMPQAAPVKIDVAKDGNLAQVHYRYKHRHRHGRMHYHRYHRHHHYHGLGIRIWPPLCIGFC
jgi:hypothetical protein